MSDKTFGMTAEDVRKLESKESRYNDGKTDPNSEASIMKSIIAGNTDPDRIDKVKANLPLPDEPVGGKGKAEAPESSSVDARTVNVGSGGVNVKLGTQSSDGLREPATADSSARIDGQEWKKPTAP